MEIKVVSGKGSGKTQLSAFDAALKDAGVYNYNLIALSSIIPPGSVIEKVGSYQTPDKEYGHKLYVIMSDIRSTEKGKAMAAGIGWFQREDGDHRGMFVEHSSEGIDEEDARSKVERDIKDSLSDLCLFRGMEFDESKVNFQITTNTVGDQPAVVITLAIYKAEGWR